MIRQQLCESGQLLLLAQLNCYAYKPTLAVLKHTHIAHLGLTISCCLTIHRDVELWPRNRHFGIGLMMHAGKCNLLYAQHVLDVSLCSCGRVCELAIFKCK